jgi:hypothetical protein
MRHANIAWRQYFLQVSALLKFRRFSEIEGTKKQTARAVRSRNCTDDEKIDWWTKYYASKEVILFIDVT